MTIEVSGDMTTDQAAEAFGNFFSGESDAPKDEQQAAPAQAEAPPAAESEDDAAARLLAEDEQQGEHQEETAEAKPDKFTVEVDGKPVELTAAEVAEAYKAGLRQADYTKKTMEVAEERKAANAEREQARIQRDNYAHQLSQFVTAETAILQESAAQLTDELLDSDPVAYMKLQRTLEARQAKLFHEQQNLQQIEQQRQAENVQAAQESRAKQLEAIQAKLPAWKDPAVMKKEVGDIKDYLFAQGFAEADLSNMQDHKFVLLARQAMQFQQLQARAKEATKKLASVPAKVERPGAAAQAPDGRSSTMRQFAKTGSRDDAAAAFGEMFG